MFATRFKTTGCLSPCGPSSKILPALCLAILVAIGLPAKSAWAGESEGVVGSTTATTLDVVNVVGHLEEIQPQELAQYGVKVDVITSEQIQDGGYQDVASVLQALAPGLYVASKNGPFDYVTVSLQGSRTEDVLWLLDGVRLNNRLYAGTTPLDTLPASMVERIEILDGGQSLIYGTQAVAGAINIVTKSYSEITQGAVTLGSDSHAGRHLDAWLSGSTGKQQFVLFGSSDKSDGYHAFREQDYQPSNTDRDRGYDVQTVGIKYGYWFSDLLRLDLTYQHTDADLDYSQPYLVARDQNDRKENILTAKLDYDVNDWLSVYAKAYVHRWDTHYDTYYNRLSDPGTIDVLYDNAFWGYKDRGVNIFARLRFQRGVEYNVGFDQQSYGGRDEVLVIGQHSEHTGALFAQARTTDDMSTRFKLSAGVRYNHPSDGRSALVWNVGSALDINQSLYIRGTVGTAFRLPTAEELYANDPQDERGNLDLKPERSSSVNLSIGGKLPGTGGMHWELTGFRRRINDLIDYAAYDETTGQDVFGNIPGIVTVRGGEADLSASFGAAISASLDYTINHSRASGSSRQIADIPVQQGKLQLDWHPTALPVGATLSVNHVGDLYTSDSFYSGRKRYGNYTVADFSARVFLDHDRRSRVDFHVYNLFDRRYATSLKRGQADAGGYYTYWNLGLPRTLNVTYNYAF